MDDEHLGLTWSTVENYLRARLDTTFRLNGTNRPHVDYVILGQDIELRVELSGHQQAPASRMPMIRIDEIASDGARMARLRTADPTLRRDFHDLVCAIAERIVVHKHRLDHAMRDTLHAWSALLQGPRVLQQQHLIGLFGELAAFWTLGIEESVGWARAADAWLGPAKEEHDFVLADYDLEVKTTSLTSPVHTIHGMGQLTPKPGRPLWLLSLQVTRGGDAGVTLAELGRAVRQQVATHAVHRLLELDEALALSGGHEAAYDVERWLLAAIPQPFAVDQDFPRIDESTLATLPAASRSRVEVISYRVDLTGLSPAPNAPAVLSKVHLPDLRTT